jgi:uncharacterized protein YcfJ
LSSSLAGVVLGLVVGGLVGEGSEVEVGREVGVEEGCVFCALAMTEVRPIESKKRVMRDIENL